MSRYRPEVLDVVTLGGRGIYRQAAVLRLGPWLVLRARPPLATRHEPVGNEVGAAAVAVEEDGGGQRADGGRGRHAVPAEAGDVEEARLARVEADHGRAIAGEGALADPAVGDVQVAETRLQRATRARRGPRGRRGPRRRRRARPAISSQGESRRPARLGPEVEAVHHVPHERPGRVHASAWAR